MAVITSPWETWFAQRPKHGSPQGSWGLALMLPKEKKGGQTSRMLPVSFHGFTFVHVVRAPRIATAGDQARWPVTSHGIRAIGGHRRETLTVRHTQPRQLTSKTITTFFVN
jgi:hypothetical protein